MPSRCIFFFSTLRAWSTLLSRTRTCTRRSSSIELLMGLMAKTPGPLAHGSAQPYLLDPSPGRRLSKTAHFSRRSASRILDSAWYLVAYGRACVRLADDSMARYLSEKEEVQWQ